MDFWKEKKISARPLSIKHQFYEGKPFPSIYFVQINSANVFCPRQNRKNVLAKMKGGWIKKREADDFCLFPPGCGQLCGICFVRFGMVESSRDGTNKKTSTLRNSKFKFQKNFDFEIFYFIPSLKKSEQKS